MKGRGISLPIGKIIIRGCLARTMPRGLKETSGLITISANITESAANTFTDKKVDLQLNPLDNEVFVVYGIDLDVSAPELIPATVTDARLSMSTVERTTIGGIGDSNVLAHLRITTQENGGGAVTNTFSSDSAPSTQLEYLGIIATNDFFLNITGNNNAGVMLGSCRVYGVRAKADAAVYAALVQSEVLS